MSRVCFLWSIILLPCLLSAQVTFSNINSTHFPIERDSTGQAFFDIDGDGDIDMVDTSAGFIDNFVYLNDGNGVFSQAPNNAGVPTNGEGHSVIPGDLDNDGDMDFAIGWYWMGGSKVYKCNNGVFVDISGASGVGNPGNIHGGGFADVDGDGDLDLSFAVNGSNRLYINDGTGHFTDEAGQRGVAVSGYGISTIFADLDGDGDVDLLTSSSTHTGGTKFHRNNGHGYFVTVTDCGIVDLPAEVCFPGDIDNDGDLDVYHPGYGLYLNDGQGNFVDITATSGITPTAGRCGMWVDVNNDGYLDLWAIGKLWLNNGDRTFQDITAASGLGGVGEPHAITFGDIDGDGDLDFRTSNILFRNNTDNNHYLVVAPRSRGFAVAHNAKVWVYQAGQLGNPQYLLGYREIIMSAIRTGGSVPYAHFGLPNHESVDVRVRFLDGSVQEFTAVSCGNYLFVQQLIAPKNLSAQIISTSRVDLSWSDNSDNEQGFVIERKRQGQDYSAIVTLAADFTDYSDQAVPGPGKYYYRIKAYNANGDSAYFETTVIYSAPYDFNGDGNSDLLWRRGAARANVIWLMTNSTMASGGVTAVNFTADDRVWCGKFSNDDNSDLVVHRPSQADVTMYVMNGIQASESAVIATAIGTDQHIVGVGNFNRTTDNKSDIVWRNTVNGANEVWLMDKFTILAQVPLPSVDSNWKMIGVGDFNGDGRSDLLWRKNTGHNVIWLMDDSTVLPGSGNIYTVTDFNWQIVAIYDFDGDGKSDLFWRNQVTGFNVLWMMDQLAIKTSGNTAWVALDWQIVSTGNYGNAGNLLWRKQITDSGFAVVWKQISAGKPTSSVSLQPQELNQSWKIVGNLANHDVDLSGISDSHSSPLIIREPPSGNLIPIHIPGAEGQLPISPPAPAMPIVIPAQPTK